MKRGEKMTELSNIVSLLAKKKNSIIAQSRFLANPSHQVFVDNTEDPIFVLFAPRQRTIEEQDQLSYYLYIDDKGHDSPDRDGQLAEFLDSHQLNDTSKSIEFNAINVSVFHALMRYFASRKIIAERMIELSNVFVFDNQATIDLPALDENYVLDSIRLDEVDEINRCWKYRSDYTRGLMIHSIANYPSVCIRDSKQGDRLACFIIATSYGLQNHLFTYPEYRNKGLAKVVTVTHARRLEPMFGAAISTVVNINTASENMFKKMNYKVQNEHQVIWLGTGEFVRSTRP